MEPRQNGVKTVLADPAVKQNRTIILLITHKAYEFPKLLPIYHPLQVGFANRIDPAFWRDNSGDNIAERNRSYCELTGLYWAWKNLDYDTLGLCHYRRLFLSPGSFRLTLFKKRTKSLLSEPEIESLLSTHDMIVPKKRHYWIETRESQYAHAHHIEDLKLTETVIRERYPEYLEAWKRVLHTRSGHICNMFIACKGIAEAYCAWLFDILFEVEKRLDISGYSEKDQRVFGYLGERLLDVYIDQNGLNYIEVPIFTTESQHWFRKGAVFLKRKILNQSHEKQ